MTFLNSADILIGTGPGAAVVLANIATATNNGATTSVVIETASGVTFVDSALDANLNAAVQSKTPTTVANAKLNTANSAVDEMLLSDLGGATVTTQTTEDGLSLQSARTDNVQFGHFCWYRYSARPTVSNDLGDGYDAYLCIVFSVHVYT